MCSMERNAVHPAIPGLPEQQQQATGRPEVSSVHVTGRQQSQYLGLMVHPSKACVKKHARHTWG